MNISIVIPNYNGEIILKKNLPKLLDAIKNYKNGTKEVIIADDCSVDDSVKVIKKLIESNGKKGTKIKLLISSKNKGFSSNVNKGFAAATGEIVILLNTDVIPSDDFLIPILRHFSDERVFAVGCMNESVENGKIVLRGRGIGQWKKGFLVHSGGLLDKDNTLWISGGSGAFKKEIWDKLGGLDEIYDPFYWEDIDISYIAQRAGYKCIFEKTSIVRHEHEKGAIKNKYSPAEIKKIAYRNQFIFVWKNADLGLVLNHIFWLPYYLVTSFLGDRLLIIGFLRAFLVIGKVLSSRRKTRKHFKLTDRQVMQAYKT